jgi:BlaI family transcriptional regulator, penicillinase repressor
MCTPVPTIGTRVLNFYKGTNMKKRPPLSKGEFEIARVIWKLGRATVGQVYDNFPGKDRIDYTTVQTFIRRLESKGYLNAERAGRNKIYSPKIKPGQVIVEAVNDFVDQMFDGQVIPLMRHLVDSRNMSAQELEQLRNMLDKAEFSEDLESDPDDDEMETLDQ